MNLRNLRLLAVLEGTSLLILLFVAMPMKYQFGIPEATKIVGPAHGMLFVGYVVMLFSVTGKGLIAERYSIVGLLAAFLPFGTWVFEQRVLKPANSNN